MLRAMWLDWDVGAKRLALSGLGVGDGGVGGPDLCFEDQRERDGKNET